MRRCGGVTLTGGEPTAQPDFAFAVAALCKEADIHVAMETCGLVAWEALERLASVVDLFLYDVKHPDLALHEEYTGETNELILENLGRLVEARADVIARVPLIPSINDDAETVAAMAQRIAETGVEKVTLLPYNPATPGKYSWVRRQTAFERASRQSPMALRNLRSIVEDAGMTVIPG